VPSIDHDQTRYAGLAQLVERWSHNPKVVSSILTPGSFARMNSEGSGLGLQIQGGVTSQWFESTFCAYSRHAIFYYCLLLLLLSLVQGLDLQ
jgi:hypothetical protein